MHIDFPYHISGQRGTAVTSDDDHIRDMIEQVLFTAPGERPNRPDFGCNLMQLVFAPNRDELATATQFMVQGALQQWLGSVIQVQQVKVESQDATLRVTVEYLVLRNRQARAAEFVREI
jgi:phage baseplate assembly protein W